MMKNLKYYILFIFILGISPCLSADPVTDDRIDAQDVRELVRASVKGRWPELQDDRAIRFENYWVKVIAGIDPERRQREFVQEQIRYYFMVLGDYLHEEDFFVLIEHIERGLAVHIEALNSHPGKQVINALIGDMINRQRYISNALLSKIGEAGSIAIEHGGYDVGRLWHDVRRAQWPGMVGKGFGNDEMVRTENQLAYDRLQTIIRQLSERITADTEIYSKTGYYEARQYNGQQGKWMALEQHKKMIDREISILNIQSFVLSDLFEMSTMLFMLDNSMMGFGVNGETSHQAISEFRKRIKDAQVRFENHPEKYVVFCKDGSSPFRFENGEWQIINAKGEMIDSDVIGRTFETAGAMRSGEKRRDTPFDWGLQGQGPSGSGRENRK